MEVYETKLYEVKLVNEDFLQTSAFAVTRKKNSIFNLSVSTNLNSK